MWRNKSEDVDVEARLVALETENKEYRAAIETLVSILQHSTPMQAWMRTSMGDPHPALVPFTRDPYSGKLLVHAGRHSQEA